MSYFGSYWCSLKAVLLSCYSFPLGPWYLIVCVCVCVFTLYVLQAYSATEVKEASYRRSESSSSMEQRVKKNMIIWYHNYLKRKWSSTCIRWIKNNISLYVTWFVMRKKPPMQSKISIANWNYSIKSRSLDPVSQDQALSLSVPDSKSSEALNRWNRPVFYVDRCTTHLPLHVSQAKKPVTQWFDQYYSLCFIKKTFVV